MIRTLTALAAAAAAAVALVAPAGAITNGQVDGTGHPEVGALVATFSDGTYPYCSGTLISPAVFLTAAHCGRLGPTVQVTFDPAFSTGAVLYTGTFVANPGYDPSAKNPDDIAVVLFSSPVLGIAPAQLPGAGLLDSLEESGTLAKKDPFTAVGYGIDGVPKAKLPLPVPMQREWAVSGFLSLDKAYLDLTQRIKEGFGGTCYGDSGGPNFVGSGANETQVIAGITITGDKKCKSTNVDYRLDTPQARGFLAGFVPLP